MFEDFKLNKRDKYFLLFILIFSTILVIHYIYFNLKIGVICSDVYVYLVNALYYLGENRGATDTVFLSPVVCFLTSLLFRLGLYDTVAIYIVTGILAIIGNIGLYILLRRYFNPVYSTTGVIIYSTLSLNLTWLANGTLDVPAVAVTIWLILLSIIAIDENPKFYTYAVLMLVIGFFTRYTVILAIPPLVLYYVYQKGFTITPEDKKHVKKAIIVGAVVGIAILVIVVAMGHGQFWAGQQMINRAKGETGFYTDPAFNPSFTYYLEKLPNFISNANSEFYWNPVLKNPTILSWAVIVILIIGTILSFKNKKLDAKREKIFALELLVVSFLIFANVSPLITIYLTMVGLYLLCRDMEDKIPLLMLMWILSNLIFYSNYNIKVSRYIIPITPALIYFLINGLSAIKDHVKINKNIIPIILIILFATQGFAYTMAYEPTDRYNGPQEVIDYIMEKNDNNTDIEIGVSNIRAYSWLYGPNATGLVARNQSAIDQSNVTYYISDSRLYELQNFTEIKTFNGLYLYERIDS